MSARRHWGLRGNWAKIGDRITISKTQCIPGTRVSTGQISKYTFVPQGEIHFQKTQSPRGNIHITKKVPGGTPGTSPGRHNYPALGQGHEQISGVNCLL